MSEEAFENGDLRADIGDALKGWMSKEKLDKLLTTILEIEKQARGWCPNCRKQVQVTIPDAKAVVSAMADLANQGFGRPGEAQGVSDEDKIVVEYRVIYEGEAPSD